MKKFIVTSIVLSVGAALVACVSIELDNSPLVVSVSEDGAGCRIIVAGKRVTSDRLIQITRTTRFQRAIVIYTEDTPFKCVAIAINALQRGGLAKIDAVIWDGFGDR